MGFCFPHKTVHVYKERYRECASYRQQLTCTDLLVQLEDRKWVLAAPGECRWAVNYSLVHRLTPLSLSLWAPSSSSSCFRSLRGRCHLWKEQVVGVVRWLWLLQLQSLPRYSCSVMRSGRDLWCPVCLPRRLLLSEAFLSPPRTRLHGEWDVVAPCRIPPGKMTSILQRYVKMRLVVNISEDDVSSSISDVVGCQKAC